MVYSLTLLLLSQPVPVVTENPELQQQFAKVTALRIEELAELTAAAQVRKLQHQLEVAELKAKIAQVQAPKTASVEATSDPLAHLQVLGVVGINASVQVWLRDAEKSFFISPNRPGPKGLQLVRKQHQWVLKQGDFQRVITLSETW